MSSKEQTTGAAGTATFGAGCFWCVEAIFERLEGVLEVKSGYSGGFVQNPTYQQVCSGNTGHAEVVQVTYNPSVISFPELLEVFWATHDPTTPNQQGADRGTQYRSVIYYHSEEQKQQAEQYKEQLNSSGAFQRPIVTEISPAGEFFEAEAYHQQYYAQKPDAPYCQYVIRPKLDKFNYKFGSKLKEELQTRS